MKTSIAVTGASGHIGNVICRMLIVRGFHVKALYHSDKRSLEGLPLELFQGDILVKEDLIELVEGCDVVINCAAIISIHGDPTGIIFKTNTEGPSNVFEIAKTRGVKKFIHLSSVHAVEENPQTLPFDETRSYKTASADIYDYSKASGEQQVLNKQKSNAIEVVVLRPSSVIGRYDFKPSEMGKALLDFYHQKIPALPEGGFDFVDVRDVAQSVIEAIDKGRNGEIYLLSGKYYTLKELAHIVSKVTGKKIPDSNSLQVVTVSFATN
ncbi:MAG: NAD-dependent epimerase/dehydratase family protein [Bacteroidetes bacterium]|nr:NAD-dependent epimerase/dehydratase family protein [Bacteroidota bacterium]